MRCKCKTCEQVRKFVFEKVDGKIENVNEVTATVNLCEEDVVVGEEFLINHTYNDLGQQMMTLDIGALMSLARVSWVT